MVMRLLFIFLLFSPLAPARYAEPNVYLTENPLSEMARSPASKLPSRVFAFTCRSIENFETFAVGLTKQTMPIQRSDRSEFAMTLYVKKGREYTTHTLSGPATNVPEGMILRAKWELYKQGSVLFHFHPNDNTKLPGVEDELECRITGFLESI